MGYMKSNTAKQLADLDHRWKTALADYQNLQRRHETEKSDFIAFANSGLILKLLTVLDHLKLAGDTINDQGLTIAVAELDSVLKEEGLKAIEVIGQLFDPATMEAVELVSGEKDKVIAVVSKGYLLKDKLLRPAKVQVGKG